VHRQYQGSSASAVGRFLTKKSSACACSLLIHCLVAAYSLPMYLLVSAYSLHVHRLLTVYSQSIHCKSDSLQSCSLSVRCLFAAGPNHCSPSHCPGHCHYSLYARSLPAGALPPLHASLFTDYVHISYSVYLVKSSEHDQEKVINRQAVSRSNGCSHSHRLGMK
jgi:hypothetical protein